MPPNLDKLALPFVTRDMLNFEHGTVFDLQLETRSDSALKLDIIGATREGTFKYSITTNGTRALETNTFQIADVPIFITVQMTSTAITDGIIFGSIYLRANSTRLIRLCSGYINSIGGLSWPLTQTLSSVPNRGYLGQAASANPAANVEAVFTVPTNTIYKIHGAVITLVTDANAANRQVYFDFYINESSGEVAVPSPVTQPASTTYTYYLMPYPQVTTSLVGTSVFVPIPPDMHVYSGGTIETRTTNLQVGDNWGSFNIKFEQFLISYDT